MYLSFDKRLSCRNRNVASHRLQIGSFRRTEENLRLENVKPNQSWRTVQQRQLKVGPT